MLNNIAIKVRGGFPSPLCSPIGYLQPPTGVRVVICARCMPRCQKKTSTFLRSPTIPDQRWSFAPPPDLQPFTGGGGSGSGGGGWTRGGDVGIFTPKRDKAKVNRPAAAENSMRPGTVHCASGWGERRAVVLAKSKASAVAKHGPASPLMLGSSMGGSRSMSLCAC